MLLPEVEFSPFSFNSLLLLKNFIKIFFTKHKIMLKFKFEALNMNLYETYSKGCMIIKIIFSSNIQT